MTEGYVVYGGEIFRVKKGKLYLKGKGVKSISEIEGLHRLTELEELYLSNNQITDISPLSGLSDLRTLWILQGNPLNEESLNVLIPELEERGTEVR